MDITACPEPGCTLPAEIVDRAVLESSDGPIEHARIACLGGHRFLMPIQMLPQRVVICGTRRSAITVAQRAGEHPQNDNQNGLP